MAIELRTHTGLWHVEKKLYSFYDVQLPFPVALRQIVIVIGLGVPWWWLMATVGVTFGPPFGHLLYLAPPGLLAWASGKPLMEGKTIGGLIGSQLKYFGEARKYARLRPYAAPEMVIARCDLWHPGHVQDRTRVQEPHSLTLLPKKPQPQRPDTTQPVRMRRIPNLAEPQTTSAPQRTPTRTRAPQPRRKVPALAK